MRYLDGKAAHAEDELAVEKPLDRVRGRAISVTMRTRDMMMSWRSSFC